MLATAPISVASLGRFFEVLRTQSRRHAMPDPRREADLLLPGSPETELIEVYQDCGAVIDEAKEPSTTS
jgi:hypothetical protein